MAPIDPPKFTVVKVYGEDIEIPVRSGIVAEYVEDYLGYLIQRTEDGGYRFIAVELGEQDDYGTTFPTLREAIKSAREDWNDNGQGDRWAEWSRKLAADADRPELLDPISIASFIAGELGTKLTQAEIEDLSVKLADRFGSVL